MAVTSPLEIFTHFQEVEDPRVNRTKLHSLYEIIVMALCAAICGAEGWCDVERFAKTNANGSNGFWNCLGQIAVNEKSNEIPAVPKLL